MFTKVDWQLLGSIWTLYWNPNQSGKWHNSAENQVVLVSWANFNITLIIGLWHLGQTWAGKRANLLRSDNLSYVKFIPGFAYPLKSQESIPKFAVLEDQ